MTRPRRPGLSTAVLAALIAVAPVAAKNAGEGPHYLSADAVDWRRLLAPGPPAEQSDKAKADLDAVLAAQTARTPADVARCRAEDKLRPWAFADVLGPGFTPDNCPATDKLLRQADADCLFFADAAKGQWDRRRPGQVDARVHTVAAQQTNGSYPSTQAVRGVVWAALLAELYPAHAEQLRTLGKRIGDDRVVAGIHFPTDVAAGQKLGEAVAKQLLAGASIRADLTAARGEAAAVTAAANH